MHLWSVVLLVGGVTFAATGGTQSVHKDAQLNISGKGATAIKPGVQDDPLSLKSRSDNLGLSKSSGLNDLDSKTPSKPDLSAANLAKKRKILKKKLVKYLKSKFRDTFSDGLDIFDLQVAKKMMSFYAMRMYRMFPDLSTAAIQWIYPSINERSDDLYKVYGRSRVPSDKVCPHYANETVACALQISNPALNKLLKRLGY